MLVFPQLSVLGKGLAAKKLFEAIVGTLHAKVVNMSSEILGTHVRDDKTNTPSQCCFANVNLPLKFKLDEEEAGFSMENVEKVERWFSVSSFEESDT
jgi:hypothetical protein